MPMRRFIAVFFLLGSLSLLGCDPGEIDIRPSAAGPEATLTVVMDSTLWQASPGEAVNYHVAPYMGTLPAPERLFDVRHMDLTSLPRLEEAKTYKNVLVAGVINDSSNVSRFLRSSFSADALTSIENGNAAYVQRPSLWRRNQMVIYLAARDSSSLADAIASRSDDMHYAYNTLIRQRTEVDMFDRARQPELEEQLMQKHGFAVNMQHDYLIATDTTNFVWLRRILSDTWRSVFVYYEENSSPATLTPEWVYATRDRLTKAYLQGNQGGFPMLYQYQRMETENIDFQGHYAYETRGLWQMVGEDENGDLFQYGGGGPFVNYSFYDEDTRRLYMIDGMVFAPSYPKREFLRQLEVIAYTFRTQAEVSAQAAASP
ncbi:MAG: DUF4837 family protein [Rhodothermales bacterium]